MGAVITAAMGIELRNIGARDKRFISCALQHNQANFGVIGQGLHRHRQRAPHVVVHGIEFAGIIESYITDVALHVVLQSACGLRILAHGQITFFN